MSDSLATLYARKLRLERNGKNFEGKGVLRKINRQIRAAEKSNK